MTQTGRSILWSSVPLAFLASWFVFVAVFNWDYQAKFFEPALIGGSSDAWIGPKLFAAAVTFGLTSSAFAYLASRQRVDKKWLKFALSILVSLLLFLMGLGFLLLGPAAITMMEQMRP